MRNAGLAVFILFFGLSLFEAIGNGAWLRAFCWAAVGVAFYVSERLPQSTETPRYRR